MALPEADTAKYNDFFASFKVNVLPRPPLGKVVTLKDTDSIKAATRELGAHGILSAPVRKASAPEDASWMDKYIGTADAVNLAYWLLEQKEEGDVEHLDELLRQEFSNTPIADVIDTDPATSRFAPFTPLDGERNTLLDCMVLMGKYALHRCYVVEPSADIVNVITQSSLVNFINSNMDKFEIGNKTLQELNLGHRGDVVSISPDKTFLDAFALMQKHGVSAVPMVDEAGAVMGVVSARDARLLILRPTRLRYINKPLRFFEDLHVEPFGWETVCVGEDTTFASLVATLAKTQVHRAFVVDKDKKLTGVVSLRDVIAALVKEPADSQISDYFAT